MPNEHRKLRTLLVVPWDDARGGVVSVVENLATYLQAKGHELILFHPGPTPILRKRKTKMGFSGVQLRLGFPFAKPRPLISALGFPMLFPLALVQLLWLLRKERIQVVNIHYVMNNFFYFAICRRLLNIRLVTSIHGNDAFDHRGRPLQRYSRAFKFIISSSDLVVFPSNTYQQRLAGALPVIKQKAVAIHHGINPDQFAGSENLIHMPQARRYVLCVAALVEWKGLDVLIEAVQPLLVADPSLNLVIVGDGPLRDSLEKLASSLGIQDQTQLLGSRDGSEVAKLLHGCEVFVLPSRTESFGIVVVEAFASKTPVIATAVGGIPEIIEHEKNGLLVQPDDPTGLREAIRRVLTQKNLKKILSENGYRTFTSRFCLHHAGSAYEAAFVSLLNPAPASNSTASQMSATN
jgi:glycosyltransferase involved in cell wall biosynthesis